ncbi:MAG: hypothetical protein IT374_10435 [Polyangiaceae bacterium]|nr:hypothetical protein [Polyangiaceae bacterium]
MYDPAIWTKANSPSGDASTGCPVYYASSGLQFRALDWQPCGPGCERTPTSTFYPTGYAVLGTTLVNGVTQPIASLPESTKYGQPTTSLLSWRNLATGEVYGAVRRLNESGLNGCSAPGTNYDEPRMGFFAETLFSVRWDSGFTLKISPKTPTGVSGLWSLSDTDTTFTSGGEVSVWPISGGRYPLEKPSGARWGDGDGDMMVWTDGQRLRGWRDDGQGVRTIAQGFPAPLYATAISPTRVLAVLGDNLPQSSPSMYTSLSFWWAPRAAEDVSSLGDVVEHPFRGPGGRKIGSQRSPTTWGDWATTQAAWTDEKNAWQKVYLVVHFPMKRTSSVFPRPGTAFTKFDVSVTLDETYLYMTETSNEKPYEYAYIRLKLSELDAYMASQAAP